MKYFVRELLENTVLLTGAAVLCGSIIYILGENPFYILGIFFDGAFGTVNSIAYTLFYTTPLIFTGLAVGIGFQGGMFNIGAEGQLYLGAFTAALTGYAFSYLPGLILIPFAIISAAVAGGLWGLLPGYLKGKFGSHEVITTIMMNFIAVGLLSYIVSNFFRKQGTQNLETPDIAEQATLPVVGDIVSFLGFRVEIPAPLNVSFIIAIAVAIGLYVFLWKTVIGYELRIGGASPIAARSAGINVTRIALITMFISGAIAGLVGVNEVLGYRHSFLHNFSPGYGYTGIAIALMGKNHPFGIVISAVVFGSLMRGGLLIDIYSDVLSKDIMFVFQGIFILFIAARTLTRKKYS